jgi:tripartite-type tricarboxylate transporter receptor subunit TctC
MMTAAPMIRVIAFLVVALAAPFTALAQAWPTQTVKIIVPFSPGTGMDILARTVGPKLAEMWGQPVVVDNRPGASGNIGANLVAKAPPDGYTLVMGASTLVINKTLYRNMPYDPLADLEPIGLAANASLLLVAHPRLGITSAKDLIAQAKAKPGTLVYGSPGIATPHHMAMELFKSRAGIDIVHVPFSATGPAVTQLLGGEVPIMFLPVHVAIPHVKAGRLVALGAGGEARHPLARDVPTLAELGLRNANTDIWYALWAPAHTPPAIVARIDADMQKALAMPDVREALARQGMVERTSSPAELRALMQADVARWAEVVRSAGIKAE